MQKDGDIFAVFEGEILDRPKFESVMSSLVASVKAREPGTVAYEWTLGPDGRGVKVYERYRDNDAMVVHLQGFGDFAEEFLAAVKPVSLAIFGDANDSVKAMLVDFAPSYYTKVGGFVR